MIAFFWNLLFFVIALGLLVTIHEFGHYWVARKCGVKVHRFSIGFGKTLWSRTDKHGTEFAIALIPLGGYVKMLDGRVETVLTEEKSQAFNEKSVWQRIAIIFAGPGANFIFAIFALWLMYLLGLPGVKPIVGNVDQESIASQAGLQSGMEITQVNGHKVQNWEEIAFELISKVGEENIPLTVKSENSNFESKVSMDVSQWRFDPEKDHLFHSLGFSQFTPAISTVLHTVVENEPAAKAGLKANDKIVAIDGTSVSEWGQIVELIARYPDQSVDFLIEREGQPMTIAVTLGSKIQSDETKKGYLGVYPTREAWPESYLIELTYGPIESFEKGVARTWRLVTISFEMLAKLVTGDVSIKNIGGPISIAQGAGLKASYGLVYFLGFLALISVNLGIINLLPLPMLDGGHLMFYFIEAITGRPVPEKIQEFGFRIGAMVLFLLMSIAIFNDFSRL